MTNYNERLDEILAEHREWMRGIRTDRLVGTSSEATKQAILRWVADEVIGEDDTGIITNPDSVDYGQPYSSVYVDRNEQRKILAQHGYKGATK